MHSSVRPVLVAYHMHCRNSLKNPLLAIREGLKKLKILYKHVCLGILWWQILLLVGKRDFSLLFCRCCKYECHESTL